MILLRLLITFLQIGAFTFGGGYAMLPLIQQQTMAQGWVTAEELVNFIAVSESTPGPFAVNISTYIGMKTAGFPGAVCATLGVVLPSFVIILLLAKSYTAFQQNRLVQGCLTGLKPAVIGLIAAAVLSTGQTVFFPAGMASVTTETGTLIQTAVIFVIALVLAVKRIPPILLILLCAALGIGAGFLPLSV